MSNHFPFTLFFDRTTRKTRPSVQRSESTFTVTLPSPRLAGYYAADMNGVEVQDERWDQYFDRYLYFPLLYTDHGRRATLDAKSRWPDVPLCHRILGPGPTQPSDPQDAGNFPISQNW